MTTNHGVRPRDPEALGALFGGCAIGNGTLAGFQLSQSGAAGLDL